MATEEDALLTDEQVGERLTVSPSTLRHWRSRGEGPPYVKLGGRLVRYRWADVEAWMLEAQREATA